MASKKKRVSIKKKADSSIKTRLPQPKSTYPLSPERKEPPTKKQAPFHAVGVMQYDDEKMTDYSTGMYSDFTEEQIRTHVPNYNVVPYSHGADPKPLSANQIKSYKARSKKKVFFPKFFMNPYQDLDYIVLQDIYANSMGGRIIDRKEELKFGQGITPVLKLRNPNEAGDEDAQKELLEKGQYIIDKLIMIDQALGDPDDALDPFLDTDVNTKFQALSKNASVYGRSMIIKEFTKKLVLPDGTSYPGIPNILKVVATRDMGWVEIDQESWKLKSVQIRFTGEQVVPQQMIYMEHGSNNPVYNALHYGFSEMQSMIGASRSLRQMIEVDFPTISKHVWAGMGFLFIEPEGTTPAEKQAELNNINAVAKVGRLNNLMISPDKTRLDQMEFSPKIKELVELADFLIRHNIAQTGMPQALFAQEQDSNRSTLVQKVRFFMDGVIKNQQKDDGQQIGKQWYMPNFKAVYKTDSEEFKLYKVEAEFKPLKLEAFDDSVEAVAKLNEQVPLTTKAIGELLGIDNFETMVDPDMDRPDPNKQGFGFMDSEGKDIKMKRKGSSSGQSKQDPTSKANSTNRPK